MNQLRIVLNDRNTVAELAKDPEVEMRIKQSIIDCTAKRVAKALNGDIDTAIKSEVFRITHPARDNGLFRGSWSGELRLSEEVENEIKTKVEKLVKQAVRDAVEETDVVKAFYEEYSRKKKEIESFDFDATVKKFIRKEIVDSLGKLLV